jgi:aldehyde:ferredoxin oxidoreductase
MIAAREGFGNVLADGTRAVEKGHYPPEALKYRMAVKNLMQSDPHDARILKAFALGLAVATRGMDHLRNRVTRMINARLGLSRKDDTLPERWFQEPVTVGTYAGEKIDRGEFDAMLSRFYAISKLDAEGHPNPEFRRDLETILGAPAS